MKKQVVCTLAAALAVTSLSAFAANPFVDVPSDSWAYQSVVELADAGIIQGVDGQYFQGHRSITSTKRLKWSPKPWPIWTRLPSNSGP
ncbi:S-layer homology domain-containing protein [Megasphaera sp.]|uniref:S-layer homology domain-containing protein n=1 Tax=Megasphaera sp. TaxID=2023260 RepID=UPI0030797A86